MKKKYWLQAWMILYCLFFNKLKKVVELTFLKFFKKGFQIHEYELSDALKSPLKTCNLTFLDLMNTLPKIDLTFINLLRQFVIKDKSKHFFKEFSSLPDLIHNSIDKFFRLLNFAPYQLLITQIEDKYERAIT